MRGQLLFRCMNCGVRTQGPIIEGVDVELKTAVDTEHSGFRHVAMHSCKGGEMGIVKVVGRKEDADGKRDPH